MEIPEAQFNNFDVAVNCITLKHWGNDKFYFDLLAVKYNGVIITGHNYDTPTEGSGCLPFKRYRVSYKTPEEAIKAGEKYALNISEGYKKAHELIRAAIE